MLLSRFKKMNKFVTAVWYAASSFYVSASDILYRDAIVTDTTNAI